MVSGKTLDDPGHPSLGSPYPGAKHGEVYGPNGTRCYTTKAVGHLAGKSERWASGQEVLRKVFKEPSGHRRKFFDADEFEEWAARSGRWPPPEPSGGHDWQTIAVQQERDLEVTRSRVAELDREVADFTLELEAARTEIAELGAELADALALAAKQARRAERLRADNADGS